MLFIKRDTKILPLKLEEYSKKMNLIPTSISYRKNKRTWGSCNYKNGLNFNILLMKFPIELMEYVIIHELAHIKHKNHSKSFWDLVEVYCPDYKKEKYLRIFYNFSDFFKFLNIYSFFCPIFENSIRTLGV